MSGPFTLFPDERSEDGGFDRQDDAFRDRNQDDHERHVYPLFDTLCALETRLGCTRCLHGAAITGSDRRVFMTLARSVPAGSVQALTRPLGRKLLG